MRITKYIISIIITLLVFAFIGESYVWYINGFENEYDYVTFYLQKDTTQTEMITDLKTVAQKHNVNIFTVKRTIKSAFEENIDIYASPDVKENLLKQSNIAVGYYHSIFLGTISINIHSFEEIPDISKINTYQVIGTDDNIVKFKRELINKYAGAFPRKGSPSDSSFHIGLVWSIALVFLLLLTLYNVALLKKEVLIRLVSGELLINYILKNSIMDMVFYIILFVTSLYIMKTSTNSFFHVEISITSYAIFVMINSLIYFTLLLTDYKKDMASKTSAKKLLRFSYIFKSFTIFVAIFVMAGSINLIFEGVLFYKQKEFFERYNDYSYIMLPSQENEFEETNQLKDSMYQRFLSKNQTLALIDLGKDEYDRSYVFADTGAISHLKEQIPELKDYQFEAKVYFIIPDKYSQNQIKKPLHKEFFSRYYRGNFKYNEIYYSHNIDIIALEGMDNVKSEWKKNPIIILNNISAQNLQHMNYGYIWQATMINISENQWNEFVLQNGYEQEVAYKTNVYKNYNYTWLMLKREMIIGIVLFGIILGLEGIIICTILKYEYSVNAAELSIKKIMGHNLFARNLRIILVTICYGLLGVIISILTSVILKLAAPVFIIVGGLGILLLEILFIIRYVYKFENVNIQKILKGGNL